MAGCLKQSRLQEALMDAVAGIYCRTHFDRRPVGLPRGHADLALLRSVLNMNA